MKLLPKANAMANFVDNSCVISIVCNNGKNSIKKWLWTYHLLWDDNAWLVVLLARENDIYISRECDRQL